MPNESQQQESNTPLTSVPANTNGQQDVTQKSSRDKKQFLASEPVGVERVADPSSRKSTGPRTPQGKQRSKFNAIKHGFYSKTVLLKNESRAEYASLLNGLRDDLQPQGKLEAVLVESLAALLWRKRRLFQAERAEISEKITFEAVDSIEETGDWKLEI